MTTLVTDRAIEGVKELRLGRNDTVDLAKGLAKLDSLASHPNLGNQQSLFRVGTVEGETLYIMAYKGFEFVLMVADNKPDEIVLAEIRHGSSSDEGDHKARIDAARSEYDLTGSLP